MASASEFDYVVFNESDRIDRTIEHISAIVTAEHCRTHQPEVHL